MNPTIASPIICLKHPSLKGLSSSQKRLSLTRLDLSWRATNSLNIAGIRTIGHLVQSAYDGMNAPHDTGVKTVVDIQNALDALSQSVRSRNRVDWARYVQLRDVPNNETECLYLQFSSTALEKIDPAHREMMVDVLHLGSRASKYLRHVGIDCVGAFVDLAARGIAKSRAVGVGTFNEMKGAIHALSEAARRDGSVDWVAYASERGFFILPTGDYVEPNPAGFLKLFPKVARQAIILQFGSPGRLVLEHYLLRDGKNNPSLEQVGLRLRRTKQGTALVKDDIIRMLRGSMLEDAYRSCRFRFRNSFLAPLRRLHSAMERVQRYPISYSEWERILVQVWQVTPADMGVSENLILTLLGFNLFRPVSVSCQALIFRTGVDTSPFLAALGEMERLLKINPQTGLSEGEAIKKVGRLVGHCLKGWQIVMLLRALSNADEVSEKGRFLIRPEKLARLSDQLERILEEKGSPMHFRDLTAEIRQLRGEPKESRTYHTVSSVLTSEKRFKPISRSGHWILADWSGYETRSIPDMAAEILKRSKAPMTGAQLYRLIAARRPLARKSVNRQLLADDRFRRVGLELWGLA